MRHSFLVMVVSLKSKQQRINTKNFYLCNNSTSLVSAVFKHIDKASLLLTFYWFDDISQCLRVSVSQMAHYRMIIWNGSLNFDAIFRNCPKEPKKYTLCFKQVAKKGKHK